MNISCPKIWPVIDFITGNLNKNQKPKTHIRKKRSSKFAPFIHEENSIIIVEELEGAIKAIERNANLKILLFELSLQMIRFLEN